VDMKAANTEEKVKNLKKKENQEKKTKLELRMDATMIYQRSVGKKLLRT
jgi:hypothetical protein